MKKWTQPLLILIPMVLATGCGETTGKSKNPAPRSKRVKVDDAPGIAGARLEDLPIGDATLANLSTIIGNLNLTDYHRKNFHGAGVRIAVLDNGFTGVNRAIGRTLPPKTQLIQNPDRPMQDTEHGTKLAEIAYSVATGSPYYRADRPGPSLFLYNTNGFSNFVWAIEQVIQNRIDIVLYAQVWEYGGNFDGKGFINREVKKALDAGVLWINASGNSGQASWHGSVELMPDLTAKLPYRDKAVRFSIAQDFTPTKIVLAWNDFDDSRFYHTPKDLDLYLETEDGTPVEKSQLIQDGTPPEGDRRYSAHAREIIRATLDRGVYMLKVKGKSTNFDQSSRMRLTIDGPGARMLDPSEAPLLIPADNPAVLTVGAADVAYSGRDTKQDKPEMWVISRTSFSNGQTFYGTSAASAIASGALAILRSKIGRVATSKSQITDRIKRNDWTGDLCEPCQEAPFRLPPLE